MELVLVRHGQTEWSANGRHTSRTQLPLTEGGQTQARSAGSLLAGHSFDLILTSPMERAVQTAHIAGFGEDAIVTEDLREWDYGDDEGLTTAQIRETRPQWSLWTDGAPNGEDAAAVAVRTDRVIARAREAGGDVLVFGHGHCLRVLTARWLGLPPQDGSCFALHTATVNILGYERETPVLLGWNLRGAAEISDGAICTPAR